MSNKTPLTPSMGGLDALVAAASAAGQVSRGQSGSKRKRGDTQTTEVGSRVQTSKVSRPNLSVSRHVPFSTDDPVEP